MNWVPPWLAAILGIPINILLQGTPQGSGAATGVAANISATAPAPTPTVAPPPLPPPPMSVTVYPPGAPTQSERPVFSAQEAMELLNADIEQLGEAAPPAPTLAIEAAKPEKPLVDWVALNRAQFVHGLPQELGEPDLDEEDDIEYGVALDALGGAYIGWL